MIRILIMILTLILGNVKIFADTPQVSAEIDSTSALIGNRVNLTIDFSSENKYNVIFPVIQDSLDTIEVLDMTEPDTSMMNNLRTIRRTYVITSFDSGSYSLGPYTLVYSDDEYDEFKVIKTNPLNISFRTVIVDTTQPIKDIKPLIEVGWGFYEFLPYIIILILIIAIIWLYLYSKRKKAGEKTPWIIDKPKIPPHIEALSALDKLKEEKLWQAGKVKEFHIRLTGIIRLYIERRFDIMALEMITDDILAEFEKVNNDSELYLKLKDLLTLADLAKFAKFNPSAYENQKSLDYAYEFVNGTIPVKKDNPDDRDKKEIGDV